MENLNENGITQPEELKGEEMDAVETTVDMDFKRFLTVMCQCTKRNTDLLSTLVTENTALRSESARLAEYYKVIKEKNKRLEMALNTLPARIRNFGSIPTISVEEDTPEMDLKTLSVYAKEHPVSYQKLSKELVEEGVLKKMDGMWCLGENYQNKGYAVYVNGIRHRYSLFCLKWTPKGVAFLDEFVNTHFEFSPRYRKAE